MCQKEFDFLIANFYIRIMYGSMHKRNKGKAVINPEAGKASNMLLLQKQAKVKLYLLKKASKGENFTSE
jgi:hypothetical protein